MRVLSNILKKKHTDGKIEKYFKISILLNNTIIYKLSSIRNHRDN